MSEHTPGPWRVSENNHNILSDHTGDRPVLIGTAFHDLNKFSRGITNDIEHDECHANARLIAAAPELLAACIESLGLMDNAADGVEEFGGNSTEVVDPVKNMLSAAIAKAKGETT